MQWLNFFVCCFLVARISGSNKEYWMCWCQVCNNIGCFQKLYILALKYIMFASPLHSNQIELYSIILWYKTDYLFSVMSLWYLQVAAMQDTQTRNVCLLDTGTQDTTFAIRSRKRTRLLDQWPLSTWYAMTVFPQNPGSHTHLMAKHKVHVYVCVWTRGCLWKLSLVHV